LAGNKDQAMQDERNPNDPSTTAVLDPGAMGGLDAAELVDRLRQQSELCHKINNPLTTVMGRAQLLQLKCGDNPDVASAAKLIEESSRQVAGLVREMSHIIQRIRGRLPED